MDAFNYLSVLVSIILGLGITQLLSSVARAVEHRDTGSLYLPSIAWFLVLLLCHIQTWWSFFGLSTHKNWHFIEFLFVLIQPIGLYLLSVLVLPSESAANKDQKSWYGAQRRAFFYLLALFILFSLSRDIVFFGRLPQTANAVFQVVLFLGAIVAALNANERLHQSFALVSLGAFVLYIALLFSRLGA
jgi:uncharacterized membrane protein